MTHGILTPDTGAAAVRAAGADHLDPTVVGTIVAEDPDGTWRALPVPEGTEPAGSFAVLVPASVPISDPRFPLADVEAYLRVALPAVAARARPGATLVLGSGAARRVPEGVDRSEAVERFVVVLRLVRDLAAEHGLEVILEPLHQGETDLVNTLEEALALLDAHDLADVRVVADLFHIMLEQEELAVVRAAAGRVAQAHVADTGRTPPGQGDWPIAGFLAALRDGGYDGPVSIECTWQDLGAEAGPALAALRAADPLTAAARP